MTTADQFRIAEDRARPRLMELWWALRPLKSVVRFMQTGAHPDDEISGMLAALAFRDGLNISYACSTRGEGGQNDIGTEGGLDLGALRTKEMERACDFLGMRMYWHSTHPEDSITDFGFSKSGSETLDRWGRDRTLLRFAKIVRTERPDIICPTFLDVPGQHGHHRAMTEAAHAVMDAAADPALATNLPLWQISKLYLPAWSGAGQAYDDDLPPPVATLTIPGTDKDPMSGWSWDRIGQQSRAFHRTQGMGRWVGAGAGSDWPLHLAKSTVAGPDESVFSGLPITVADLAHLDGAESISEDLNLAQGAIEAAMAAFPDCESVGASAANALRHVRRARGACPVSVADQIAHRLDDKILQLGHVLRLAMEVEVRAIPSGTYIERDQALNVDLDVYSGRADAVETVWDTGRDWLVDGGALRPTSDAAPYNPYRDIYDPRDPATPRLIAKFQAHGVDVEVPFALEVEPVLLPPARAALEPSAAVINLKSDQRSLDTFVSDVSPHSATVELAVPEGWRAIRTENGFRVEAPEPLRVGAVPLTLNVDGQAAETLRKISYDHVAPTARARQAEMLVGVIDVDIPDGRVGYIGAGNDRVGHWLAAMGADVSELSDADLDQDSVLAGFDAIVVGIFAMRFRPGLTDKVPALHRWTEAGGTLVTLYHRPWDNWDPETIPPRRLEIGQPSLRWRVTDETAEVTQLAPHPILSTPNTIGPDDWAGWVKERGLYFAKSWDPAYTPLLSISDAGEEPLNGSLLVADIGKGRHIHTSLILHHQMENLVPGAFRLMANFLARRT